jgi:uncharacterized sulfatase
MPKSPQNPNIVFIVLDTHRYDRLGAYGNPRGTSPNLDAFASQSTRYEFAIAPAQWTIPSHASMFTGEYPTTHQTTQSGNALDPHFRTLADYLRKTGYQTTGFCNNPLVGVLDNHLKRGFQTFYNYGGAIPTRPADEIVTAANLLSQVWRRYTQLLRRISYPVQNAIAKSERILSFTLNPLLVPLWSRFAHFKGDTPTSLVDASQFVEKRLAPGQEKSHFVFINLMETHLPFEAPEPFRSRLAPIMKDERAARDFMRVYNTLAMRWLLPMDEPFSPLEAETLSQMYDAEVAYQDHLLNRLLEELDTPHHRENTAVIIVADHGEMLGEHQFMSHSFGVYEELIHVPLMIRLPGQKTAQVVSEPVSTAQLFHTMMDLAHVQEQPAFERDDIPVERLSLARQGGRNLPSVVFSESYPPLNALSMLERQLPHLIDPFSCRAVYRAAYSLSPESRLEKLHHIAGGSHSLFHPAEDPLENHRLPADGLRHRLEVGVELFIEAALQRQPQQWSQRTIVTEDASLLQRMRDLGYLE